MPITRDGLRFFGSRTIGPSSHFIAVTFAEDDREPEFISVDGPEISPDPKKVEIAKSVLAASRERLPVGGRYYPVSFGLTERDTANAHHYDLILKEILTRAQEELG